tara:strand:+ start:3630 stop:4874 length:1245 start_codon:yes stop_codon:yes gene_type:complete
MRPHILTFILSGLVISATAVAEESWPQFRGPSGRGHSEATGAPTSWDESSVIWKTALKGSGQSSPVNAGDRIFLTGASDDGSERYLMCLSAKSGEMIWEDTLACANPEDFHAMNSQATPTCATDGETVVAFFGPGGLHAYSVDGEKKWAIDLGDFPGDWGVAASPVILDGKVIQNCDALGVSRLVAVDLETGKIAWDTPREDKPRGGWSTPILIEHEGKREFVLNGEFGVRGYDPESGEELWFCEAFNGRGSPVPEFANGKLYVVNGKPGDTYCVTPGGSGNVTNSHMVWHASRKGGRDLPSPTVVDDYLFITSMSGIATCYDAANGKPYYVERLSENEGIEVAAAPLVIDGLIYLQTVVGGDVVVIRPGESLDIVSVNSLGDDAKDEIFRATIAPIGGHLYLRSGTTLYCVGQ